MVAVAYPTTWTFPADAVTTRMALKDAGRFQDLIFTTPDTVDTLVAEFPRTQATPPDVASLLALAHKLLRTSIVHYEFAALAAEKSLQALERAVRIKLNAKKKSTFEHLINQLGADGIITEEQVDLLHGGRQLRNFFAHPATAPAFPVVMVTGILVTSYRIIASLFPDE